MSRSIVLVPKMYLNSSISIQLALPEFAVKPDTGFALYAQIELRHSSGSSLDDHWLTFVDGVRLPQKGGDKEWAVYVKPFLEKGDWGIYRVDLKEAVRETFVSMGSDWRYSRLTSFRLRRNVSIAYISVFRSW